MYAVSSSLVTCFAVAPSVLLKRILSPSLHSRSYIYALSDYPVHAVEPVAFHKSPVSAVRKMAWMSPVLGSCNGDLVDALVANKLVISGSRVETALRAVDRADFCDIQPYVDSPQPLISNATISAPHMHAHALSLLASHLRPGAAVLDVGAGSGFLSAAMAQMVAGSPGARVIAVEHVPDLARYAEDRINKACPEAIRACIKVVAGDGRNGVPEYAPYNAIHVGAAASKIPEELVRQLARGGRMVCPVGPEGGAQFLVVVDKKQDDSIETTRAFAVRYVPLCDIEHQLNP